MSSIATKRGDGGTTSLLGGKRVAKTHRRVRAYGAVDELSAVLGLCRVHSKIETAQQLLYSIQSDLVPLMGELATDDAHLEQYLGQQNRALTGVHVERLDQEVARLETEGGRFRGWRHSGETVAEAHCDLGRTICRRAEREILSLRESGATVRPELLQYMNRLSDLLWLLGRAHCQADTSA
ncbi:MAG: cob(I)yrinic acid a,c-diamide adenosyltransferase [Verrucomicrobiota bacterium]